jgi:tRNA (cytosine38-C5)-methyltransferase
MIQEKGRYDHLFCPESLDKPPVIHNEIYLVKEGKTPLLQPTHQLPCVGSFLDSDLPPHAQHTSTNTPKQEMLQIPEKFRSSSSSWCYDIVTPRHHCTACFTHSYGKFIRGTGSILYTGPIKGEGAADLDDKEDLTNDIDGSGGDGDDGEREDSNNTNYITVRLAAAKTITTAKEDTPSIDQFKLVPPDERKFDASWSKDLDWDNHMRYLSGNEIARLMGFPVVEKPAILCDGTTCKAKVNLDVETIPAGGERSLREFSFPPDCTMKQQWKMLGNSLNVRVAAFVAEIGIQSMLDEVR